MAEEASSIIHSDVFRPRKKMKIVDENELESLTSTMQPIRDGITYANKIKDKEFFQMSRSFRSTTTSEYDINNKTDMKIKMDSIYAKYNFNLPQTANKNLTILKDKNNIMRAVNANPVIILQGDTGCGKSTQFPQMILDDAHSKLKYCNIVVTQPRRIAAINVAKQVASERECDLGSLVGYQIGLDACANDDTRLLYCTTGVLLQKLIRARSLNSFTHIVLDEVHERTEEMDFLMIVVRKLLWSNSRNVKIILMSATIEADLFSKYFMIPRVNNELLAPIIKVNPVLNPIYKVSEFYIDNLLDKMKPPIVNLLDPVIENDMYLCALKLCYVCDTLDKEDQINKFTKERGSILIFLPGVPEIDKMQDILLTDTGEHGDRKIKFDIICLHSRLSRIEQLKVFNTSPDNMRKVILATNIAESSITLTDVKYVIDFCLTKSMNVDRDTNFPILKLEWASRNNCRQRSGRAGRVSNGRVYRLITQEFFETKLTESNPCELLRCPLENVVLKAKMLNMGKPVEILGLAMDPPDLFDIKKTVLILKEAGAMLKTCDGEYDECDGDITYIGNIMSILPIHISLSKLIIFGYLFSVLDECFIIVAGLAGKTLFSHTQRNRFEIYCNKLRWGDGSGSDCIAILNAYKEWSFKLKKGKINFHTERSYAKQYHLEIKALREMEDLIQDLRKRARNIGLLSREHRYRTDWNKNELALILNIVFAGAFYPNYFSHSSKNDENNECEIFSDMGDLDPCKTVYFKGFDHDYIGPLYTRQIKDIFRDVVKSPADIRLKFPICQQKIYVTFPNPKHQTTGLYKDIIPGIVATEVFKAVKLRTVNNNATTLRVLEPSEARKYVEKIKYGEFVNGVWGLNRNVCTDWTIYPIPSKTTKSIEGIVTQIYDCNNFWFQLHSRVYRNICHDLNDKHTLHKFEKESKIKIGCVLAIKNNRGIYCRGKVVKYYPYNGEIQYEIELIDFATFVLANFNDLRELEGELNVFKEVPPQVIQCTLTELQPAIVKSHRGHWTTEAIDVFAKQCRTRVGNHFLVAEVYSVVNCVCSVILYNCQTNINKWMLKSCFATSVNENFMSKRDHDERIKSQMSGRKDSRNQDVKMYIENSIFDDDDTVPPPDFEDSSKKISLKGPFSTLETNIKSLLRSTKLKTIQVEIDSINSIILDTNPNDHYEKLIIAATISNSQNNSKIMLRHTTILPHIIGLGPMLGLLFAPCAELRRDKTKSQYIHLLCGLGYNKETGQPLFSEHDLSFNLDAEIDEDDLKQINKLRFHMDKLLYIESDEREPSLSEEEKACTREQLKLDILQLFTKNRKCVTVQFVDEEYKWNTLEKDELIKERQMFNNSVFQLHEAEALQAIDENAKMALYSHCDELHRKCRRSQNGGDSSYLLRCKLCSIEFESMLTFRLHMTSQRHRQRENEINYNPAQALHY